MKTTNKEELTKVEENIEEQEFYFRDFMKGNGLFKLPVNHIKEDGSIIEEVTIKEISGNEEEIMMKKDIISNTGLVVTSIVDGVTKLGRKETQRMLTGNRDFIFIASCYLSFADDNDEILVNTLCPTCRKTKIKNYVKIPNLKIICKGVTNDQEINGVFPKSKKKFSSIITTGEIQEKISKITDENFGIIITQAMESCVKSIEGERFLDRRLFKNMLSKDRMFYMKYMGDFMSGVDAEFTDWDCSTCGKVEVKLSPIDFFTAE